jgi:hypothetical protein
MALPKLESPKYDMTVPSTGQEIKYRPFLVREEKILLLAMEEGTENASHNAVLDLVNSCTFGNIGNVTDPMFDVEYAFIKIRSKSVSETINVRLLCPDDGETYVDKSIDVDDIQIMMDEDHSTHVNLSDTLSIDLTYPTINTTLKSLNINSETERVFFIIKSCIHTIHFGEDIYSIIDISKKELDEFVDSLTQEMFEKLQEFFNTMPKLRHTIEVENPVTGMVSEVTLEGLGDFLN